ncbi:MAG TPA: trigger factor [Myxococcota bacterium]|nr:trigger factor [Myxococcota bacterium]
MDVETVSPIQKRLSFTVPANMVTSELDKAYRNLAKSVRLRGFRPGKAPRRVLEQRFGKSIEQEVAATLINQSFRDGAKDLEFFGQPTVDKGDLRRGHDFEFSITIEVKPELELTQYKGVEVYYPSSTVSDEVVDANVDSKLQGQKVLAEVDRAEVEAGDLVLVELEAKDGKEAVHAHPGAMINTAGDSTYKGLEESLVGLKKGGRAKTLKGITFADDCILEELAGKTLDVKVKIGAINAYTTPELTDELAEEMGFEGGAVGMREAIRMQLQSRIDDNAKNQARANLLQALIDANDFDAPAGLVEQQLKALLQEIKVQRAYRGEDPKSIQFTDAEMADYRSRARFAARSSLILDHVSTVEGIEVTDADLEFKYEEIANLRGQRVEAIKGYFLKENAVEDLRERLAEEKTLDWLLEHSELVDTPPVAAEPVAAEPVATEPVATEPVAAAETSVSDEAPDYGAMSAAALKALAKERGLKGYSKLKKAELVELLQG